MPLYADREQHRANQVDLFGAVPLKMPGQPAFAGIGMVISGDCDVDKFLTPNTPLTAEETELFTVSVAYVHPVAALTGGRPAAVRNEAMPRYMYLAAEAGLPEMCVDLWTIQPVRMVDLLSRERIASLSTEGRNTLWWKIIRLRLGQHYREILEGEIPPDAA